MALHSNFILAATAATTLVGVQPTPPDLPWLYAWRVTQIVDGDTFKVSAPWLPSPVGGPKKEIAVRVQGIDTPEKAPRAKCAREASLAQAATDYSRREFLAAKEVLVEVAGEDKYFRLLGDLWLDGVPLSYKLLQAGLAAEYDGGEKVNYWCQKAETEGGWDAVVVRYTAKDSR